MMDHLRVEFERLSNKNVACGLRRSRRGTYVNPAVARDWKWFELGAIAAAHEPPPLEAVGSSGMTADQAQGDKT